MQFGVREWASQEPDRIALAFSDRSLVTYGQLETLINQFAHLFRECGVNRGDHIAVILPNGPHILAVVWAAYRIGAYLTPVANTLSVAEMEYVVSNCTAKVIVTHKDYEPLVQGLPSYCTGDISLFSLGEIFGFDSLEAALKRQLTSPVENESAGSLMMYSSGTTGAPKAIWRKLPSVDTAQNIPPFFARDLIDIFKIDSTTRYFSSAPLYHAAPLRWALAVTAMGGYVFVLCKFNAVQALEIIQTQKITLSQWVPVMFKRLLDLPLSVREAYSAPDHKCAYHSAAPCSVDIKQAMINWWGEIICEYYSGTEGVGLTALNAEEWLRKPGSVGRCYKGKIHVLSGQYEELSVNETGMIYFSGVSKFEYFNEPEKTATRTSPQGYQTFGDIGRIDHEGYLFLSDRLDDMIISGGVNLYPMEIEHALEEFEVVAECGVVGVPDANFGESPVAFLVFVDTVHDQHTAIESLKLFSASRLGKTKQPREFLILDSLPRSATGKLLRRELRNIYPY